MSCGIQLALPQSEERSVELLRGIARYARLHTDWLLMRCVEMERLLDSTSLPHGVIGTLPPEVCAFLKARGVPIVSTSTSYPNQGLPVVAHDDRAIGHLAAEHLLSLGLRRFAYVGMEREFSSRRREGFAARLQTPTGLSLSVAPENATARTLVGWLAQITRPVGVFACNDFRARHAGQACHELGFRVPEDVALLGCDNDLAQCELHRVPISSIVLPFETIGYEAARLLHRILRGEKPDEPQILFPPIRVERRASTDATAVDDEVLRSALAYIRTHALGPVRVADVAKAAGLSRRPLEVRFAKVLGRTPHDEIWRVRFEHARRLLAESDLPVSQVAESIGLADYSRFSHLFRTALGETPSAFRNRTRRGRPCVTG